MKVADGRSVPRRSECVRQFRWLKRKSDGSVFES